VRSKGEEELISVAKEWDRAMVENDAEGRRGRVPGPVGAAPREFVAPAQGARSDWVLVLDDAAKGYPTERPK
jgi:hypothetical protein